MKKISEFNPVTFTPLTGTSEEEQVKMKKWWFKYLIEFKKTWDYSTDSGLKEIWQKGKEIRLVTHTYGDMVIYQISKEELEEELEENKSIWEKRK